MSALIIRKAIAMNRLLPLLASAAAEKLSPELMAQIDEIMGTKPKESSNADNH